MNKRIIVITGIILLAALARLLPHAPNFSPIGAIALFAGAFIANRVLSILIPVGAMIVSDAMMGFSGWNYPEQTLTVYAIFTLIVFIGRSIQNNKGVLQVGAASISSSVFFFIISNFMVWAGGFYHQPALYPTNFSGLMECYTAAIPFFRNSFAGDLFYTTILFGGYYLLQINAPKLVQE